MRMLTFLLAGLTLFAANAMGQLSPAAPDRYDPDWTSLKRHPVPKWFEDAKLGIFVHWGLYSVPAWAVTRKGPRQQRDWSQLLADPKRWFRENPYAEWYLNTMRIKDSPTWKHHVETYGENYDYLDFIPIFNREAQKWNPDEWAELFKEVGARYVVFTSKHSDGFTLWPSGAHNPHRGTDQQGAQRDIVGYLTKAVRAQGLKMGLYYCGGLDWSFVETPIQVLPDLYGTVPQSDEYTRYADTQWGELIDRYQPSVLWNDISYPKTRKVTCSTSLRTTITAFTRGSSMSAFKSSTPTTPRRSTSQFLLWVGRPVCIRGLKMLFRPFFEWSALPISSSEGYGCSRLIPPSEANQPQQVGTRWVGRV